jgi:RNA polymerase sigma factor (sigma-70 family)
VKFTKTLSSINICPPQTPICQTSFNGKRKFVFFGADKKLVGKRTQISEEKLISLLAERNQQGLEILYDNYSAALYGVIHRIVTVDEIAEDVLQETFLKIWNNFSQYDSSKGRLFTWMLNVARNLAIDKIRSREFSNQNKNQSLDNVVSQNSFSDSYNPETIGLKEMVRKLEPEYKELIDLLFFGGYTQAEAAEKLGIPLGTVKTRSRSALNRLRNEFEKVNLH